MDRNIARAALAAVVFWFAASGVGYAQQRLILEAGMGIRLENTQNAESIFVADPAIADISASPGDALYVYGKSPGDTSVVATDLAGRTLFKYDLIVIHDLRGMRRVIAQRFGKKANVTIKSSRGSILVSGTVTDELVHQDLLTSLKNSVPDDALIDEIIVGESKTIQIDVRFLEVASDKLERYGLNWSSLTSPSRGPPYSISGGGNNIDTLMDLLINNGVATVTTQSTLTTTSNKLADFSVGDQIAIPTFTAAQSGDSQNYSVDFRFIGTSIKFLPTVLPGGKVNLDIKLELSNIQASARQINGNSFPNLASRTFSTSVELKSGQGFVIAGLTRKETSAHLQKPKYQTGGLEKTESAQRDLIVVITPRFGDFEKPTVAQTITAQRNNLEYILLKKVQTKGLRPSVTVRITGPAGFLY